jgi:hypothetical protein
MHPSSPTCSEPLVLLLDVVEVGVASAWVECHKVGMQMDAQRYTMDWVTTGLRRIVSGCFHTQATDCEAKSLNLIVLRTRSAVNASRDFLDIHS